MPITVIGSGDAFGSGGRFQTCIAVAGSDRWSMTPFEVRHASGAPACALRVTDSDTGATLAYSGNPEWTDALIDASDGAEIFLCEGYAPTPVRWQLDPDTLARNRHRLGSRRLVLTHMSPTAPGHDLTGRDTAHDGLLLDLADRSGR